jgi:hypothetical protein
VGGNCGWWACYRVGGEEMITNVFMGFLAGLICSLGGALKDSPFEGFHPLKFFRSIVIGTIFGVVSVGFTTQPVLAFMFSGYCERMTVEGYKIVRAKKPGKFNLPHPSMLGAYFGFRKRKYV